MNPSTAHEKIPQVVIIGAGFAGLRAARALKNTPAKITVLDRKNHHLFQPLLYQVATAGLSPSEISEPIRHILRTQKNTEVLMTEVTRIDPEKKEVIAGPLRLPYDYLVIATGATHSYFGHPEWEEFAPGLKSIEDALAIRNKILSAFEKAELESDPQKRQAYLNFVVVGGGPTGVEIAGSIAELAHHTMAQDFRHIDPKSTRIILMEAAPRLLLAFPEDLAAKATQALQKLNVEINTNQLVEKIDGEGVWAKGELIPSKSIIWAAGVQASPLVQWIGAEVDRAGRVKVESDLSVAGHPEIFVAGDASSLTQDGKPLAGVAPVAMQEGEYAGKRIAEKIQNKQTSKPFHYKNKGNLATIGRAYAIADFGSLHVSGFFGWMVWLFVHIFYLIGFEHRVLVFLQWFWAYFTHRRGSRII